MAAAGRSDKQHQVFARFNARLEETLKASLTPAIIEEHRRRPLGRHSDALERVLNYFRRPPRYGLYSRRPMREWQVIRLPVDPNKPPQPLDDLVYHEKESALHAVFLRHVADLKGE